MTKKEKVLKLIDNLINNHADLKLVYDEDEKRYLISRLEIAAFHCTVWIGFTSLSRTIDLRYILLYAQDQDDQSELTYGIENIDSILNIIKHSYINWLADGIE